VSKVEAQPALQAAEKGFPTVILSEAKDLALCIFMEIRDSSFAMLRTACALYRTVLRLLRMTVPTGFSAACLTGF
jgi:hypothetical protein